jgi:hypothetical protein
MKTLSSKTLRDKGKRLRVQRPSPVTIPATLTTDMIDTLYPQIEPEVSSPLPIPRVGRPSKKKRGRPTTKPPPPKKQKSHVLTRHTRNTRSNDAVAQLAPSRPSSITAPTRRTRSTARPQRSIESKVREIYVAVPSSPIRRGPKFTWHHTKRRMHLIIRHNALGKDQYRRLWYCSLASASDMSHCQVIPNHLYSVFVIEMRKYIAQCN